MAATEFDIIRDEQERNNLLKAIADVETAMLTSSPGTRYVLVNTLENAKKRIAALEKKIEEAKVEHTAEVQAQAAAALAAKETKLSAEERETYRGFLEEPYFTKKDFGKLDEFYIRSYDRLSEDGKEEMSKRLHEGLRRGEFKFSDLSQAIQRRDNAHCLVKAVDETLARSQISKGEKMPSQTPEAVTKTTIRNVDLRSVDLSGFKLGDATGSPSVSDLPDASGIKVDRR